MECVQADKGCETHLSKLSHPSIVLSHTQKFEVVSEFSGMLMDEIVAEIWRATGELGLLQEIQRN